MKTRQLIKLVEQAGFVLIRSNKHLIYSNGRKQIVIPNHQGKELNHHLLAGLLKQLKEANNEKE